MLEVSLYPHDDTIQREGWRLPELIVNEQVEKESSRVEDPQQIRTTPEAGHSSLRPAHHKCQSSGMLREGTQMAVGKLSS